LFDAALLKESSDSNAAQAAAGATTAAFENADFKSAFLLL
jgi:hypothetical protein